MKRVVVGLILLALMSVTAPTASAEADVLANGELEVTHSPDSLWLRPRETDTFEMTIKNAGDRQLNVSLGYIQIECPGGTTGKLSRSFLTLAPGADETITVDVKSYASMVRGWCLDETKIRVRWGPNLTLDKDGRVDRDSVEDSERVAFELHYDPTYEVMWVVMIVVLLALVVYHRRQSSRGG